MKIEIHDIVALALIAGGIALKALGHDGIIDTLLIAIASFYLGLKLPTPSKNGNQAQSSESK